MISEAERGWVPTVADRRSPLTFRREDARPIDKKGLMFVLLIAATATFLRTWNLTELGYNSDEAVYAGQAAGIAGSPGISRYFPVFRAHPMLFQTILSLLYGTGFNELAGRALSATFGIATVGLAYLLGRRLYGRRAGLITAFLLAVMPYHVVTSRQLLLDGPMTFFVTLTLYLVARYAETRRPAWLWAAGGGMGLAFLTKETSILFLGGLYGFFALAPEIRVRVRDTLISLGTFILVALPFPLSIFFAGKTTTGHAFLIWQLFRRPNHSWSFYPSTLPWAVGPAVLIAAAAGLWWLRRQASWREKLLLSWIAVPGAFFQLWPVKGFQYLLPLTVPLALLAARTLSHLRTAAPRLQGRSPRLVMSSLLTAAVAVTLVVPSWVRIRSSGDGSFLAGTGGVPGGREAGRWVGGHAPEGATILTLGPSMANIIQFYGRRKAYGLSVSPNPLHRNPTYEAVNNADLLIRTNELHYAVWDSFSAGRSKYFSDRLLRYVDRYNGREVHRQSIPVFDENRKRTRKPVIIIYELRP